ncbi:hypothetical protein CRG98_025747 [Punica granatum]|uniref:Uncharacterized protein n=1 Tax=Punica granatum TaxID=22663 RepID=A0A2I0JC87_PUNGR|nr:hypothetical protein CRG98_025747 [Punica granatum]
MHGGELRDRLPASKTSKQTSRGDYRRDGLRRAEDPWGRKRWEREEGSFSVMNDEPIEVKVKPAAKWHARLFPVWPLKGSTREQRERELPA